FFSFLYPPSHQRSTLSLHDALPISILGIMAVKAPAGKMEDPMKPINRGFMTSAVASVIGFFIVNYFYMTDPTTGSPDWRFGITADRKSTRLNSSHGSISYAVFCLKK